ncbi:hypothetical protein BH09PSE4_BH09PSE4_07210 [soil metagenome]
MKRSAILLAALITTASVALPAQTRPPAATGIDQSGLDKSVKPGDNFDEYANGGWRAVTEIPADRSATGVFLDVFKVAEARNAEVIAGASAANAAPGTDQRRIADFYTAYLDTAGIEARGLAPIQPELAAIAAIPDKTALSKALGADLRADVDPINATNFHTEHLFGLFVTQAFDNPAQETPYLLQGGLGLPERDYYLSASPQMAEARAAYLTYLTKVFTLAGMGDPAMRAARVMALETKIATAHLDYVTAQDVHKANNVWQQADFMTKAPGLDWNAFFGAAGLSAQSQFIVWMPDATTRLSALVASEPLAAWQDWMAFHHINAVSSVLPKAFDDASFDFYGKALSGTQQPRPRDKRAIAVVNGNLGDAVGQVYVTKFFPASSKADIQGMVKNILAAFDNRVANLTWMAPATKAEARRKIETMRVGVGYP